MTPSQQAELEQVAREWLRKTGFYIHGNNVTEDRVTSLVTLLSAQRAAVLEEEVAPDLAQMRTQACAIRNETCLIHELLNKIEAKIVKVTEIEQRILAKSQEQRP